MKDLKKLWRRRIRIKFHTAPHIEGQKSAEARQSWRAILVLRSVFGGMRYDAGPYVLETYGGFALIAVLTAWSRRFVRVHFAHRRSILSNSSKKKKKKLKNNCHCAVNCNCKTRTMADNSRDACTTESLYFYFRVGESEAGIERLTPSSISISLSVYGIIKAKLRTSKTFLWQAQPNPA